MLSDFAMFDRIQEEQLMKAAAADGRELTRDDIATLIDIATRRQALMLELKQALRSGDEPEAIRLARQVCGLPAEVTE
jgi:hypothetical protein